MLKGKKKETYRKIQSETPNKIKTSPTKDQKKWL